MQFEPISSDEMDYGDIDRELDKVKSEVFMSKHNPAFLGSLMCSLNFIWSRDIETSATDGETFWWNPDRFMRLPKASRHTDLCHELWHVGLLHMVRRGDRDPGTWNIACDIRIDLLLESEGFTFEGVGGVDRDPKYIDWVEEDIYDDLMKNGGEQNSTCMCHTIPGSNETKQNVINAVVKGMHQAELAKQAGNLPGQLKETLDKFLAPVIPWQTVLMKFFTDMLEEDYSWKRPNRRYQDMYLPSRFTDDGRLEHLAYYLDVSMSIQDSDVLRFNSEVKYIQEVLKPQKLSLIQFDTEIKDVREFEEDEPFDEIEITGRGGTGWACIKEHMEKIRPTAAVIFTDMGFWDSVTKPNFNIPIIWVCIRDKHQNPPFGEMIHID